MNAAVYARISEDRTGEGAGVDRQIEDASALAEQRGWTVVETFIDNDRSAFNGTREAWQRMLGDLRAGRVQSVVAWANDRLYRRVRDQLELMEVVRDVGGRIVTARDGDVDPASASGRMTMGILANVAEFESDRKAERVVRANDARAASGKPHGAAPYGWRIDGPNLRVLEPDEAGLIREAAMRVIRGETTHAIVADWTARGITTRVGTPWHVGTLRRMLRRPANAGLRLHRGEVIGRGDWPPILDESTHDALVAALRGKPQGRRGTYLLTGLARCATDGTGMAGHRSGSYRGYECRTGGCFRRIAAEPLDELVTERVLDALDDPRFLRRLAEAGADSDVREATVEFQAASDRLQLLAEMFGVGEMERAEYAAARESVVARRDDAERRLQHRDANAAVAAGLATMPDLRGFWAEAPVGFRRSVLAACLERIDVEAAERRGRWEPERVSLVWRS